jgi:predicted outer membrane repeat protein
MFRFGRRWRIGVALLVGFATLGTVLLNEQAAGANTIIVTNCNDSGAGSLRQAVAESGVGDTITFDLSPPCPLITLTSGDIEIASDLTISGPGQGNLAISGNSSSNVFVVDAGINADISGLTIENGSGAGGGAIDTSGGNVTLTNDTFSDNSASRGGAIYSLGGGAVSIAGSTFSGNTATNYGGAIYSAGGGSLSVSTTTFSSNTGGDEGGGIYSEGPLVVASSTLADNTATNGGGLYASGGNGPWQVNASTLANNSATLGGAIDNDGWTNPLNVENSTITGNDATLGGGIYNASGCNGGESGGGTIASNDTLWANDSLDGPAGDVYNFCGSATLEATIVAGSAGDPANGHSCGGSISDGGFNLSDDSSCDFGGSSQSNTQAGLDPAGLQNNGGLTQTIALEPGSAAIGQGGSSCPATDQRGMGRPAPCDTGAYQSGMDLCPGGVLSDQTSGSSAFGTLTATAGSCLGEIEVGIQAVSGVVKGPFDVGEGVPDSISNYGTDSDTVIAWTDTNDVTQLSVLSSGSAAFRPADLSTSSVDASTGNSISAEVEDSGQICSLSNPPGPIVPICTWEETLVVTVSLAAQQPFTLQLADGTGSSWNGVDVFDSFPQGAETTIAPSGESAVAVDEQSYASGESTPLTFWISPSGSVQGGSAIPCGPLTGQDCGVANMAVGIDQMGDVVWNWTAGTHWGSYEVIQVLTASGEFFDQAINIQQSLAFLSNPPTSAVEGSSYDAFAISTSASGQPVGPVTYTSSTPSICAVVGDDVTHVNGQVDLLKAGTCTVNADQPGGGGYLPATEVSQTFQVWQPQSISIQSTQPDIGFVGGPDYTVLATGGGSGNPVTIETSGACTSSANIVSFTSVGTCEVFADQAGGGFYLAAPEVQQTIPVSAIGIQTASLPQGSVRLSYLATLQGIGGELPYKWSIESGALPSGLHLSASTGVISGKPLESGISTFTVKVVDHVTTIKPPHNQSSYTQTLSITVTQPTPTVTLVHLNSGPGAGGNKVTITGTSLWAASSVTFGGVPGTILTVNATGTTLTAYPPAESAGTVDVQVTTPGGTSSLNPPADDYTYLAPTITKISPKTGSGGTIVAITGKYFQGAMSVTFGGFPATNVMVLPPSYGHPAGTQITATAPTGLSGSVDIQVTTPGGGSAVSTADVFTYS